ncbi:MAG: cupredoxin domain-containing protein [Actinomycetota bacterium]
MTTKLLTLVAATALLAGACSQPPEPEIDLGTGRRFVPQVVDFIDDVGRFPSLSLGSEGIPFMSYWAFPEIVEEGEIPPTRPIQAPMPPGVFLASEVEGVFHRGAFAQGVPIASGATIPFAPVYEKALASALPENVNGSAVALDAGGTAHSAWVANTGLWYGTASESAAASFEQVVKFPRKLPVAGPVGWPAIAIGEDSSPWIAWAEASGGGQRVQVASQRDEGWTVETVATIGRCAACAEPERVAIEWSDDSPVVAFADPTDDALMAATRGEQGWEVATIESGAIGRGVSLAIDGSGSPRATYYTGLGAVHEARASGDSWEVNEVAAASEPTGDLDPQQVDAYRTTGVAIDDEGTSWVTWFDASIPGVKLASSADGSSWEQVETADTDGGAMPDVAVAPDGSAVYMVWFDTGNQNLVLGTYADHEELVLANPSPQATNPPIAQPDDEEPAGPAETELTIVAQPGASANGFDTSTLVGSAGEDLTVTFDNQDPGVIHNWKVYDGPDIQSPELGGSSDLTGPDSEDVPVDPLDPADYFYVCTYHPTTMTGTLTAE